MFRHASATRIVMLILLLWIAGCSSSATAPNTGTTTHMVVCWLKEPGNADARKQLIERSKSFAQIPGVRRVVVGRPLPSTRPAVDSSFDVALVIDFESEQALRDYDQSPLHRRAVKEVLQPLVQKFIIYDFWNE